MIYPSVLAVDDEADVRNWAPHSFRAILFTNGGGAVRGSALETLERLLPDACEDRARAVAAGYQMQIAKAAEPNQLAAIYANLVGWSPRVKR